MNTAKKSIYDTTPYLNRRFKGIRYGYRPRKYDYDDVELEDGQCWEAGELEVAGF